MRNIEVKILQHNMNGTARFLAMLTQRGHEIGNMEDLQKLYDSVIDTHPSKKLLSLPHTTLKRMNYMTVAIVGLSTKAVSQLRTHATRLTFISTSTQYSAFDKRPDNWVMPDNIEEMQAAFDAVNAAYANLIDQGVCRDVASYLLPQGLRKALIISGHLDAWHYVMQTRLCKRNTDETRYIMELLYNEIRKECGEQYLVLPKCATDKCPEGKFCCGKPYEDKVYTFPPRSDGAKTSTSE